MRSSEPGRRTFRARLAVLYACFFLISGVALLAIADLPMLHFGQTARVLDPGGRTSVLGPARSLSNLPEVLLYSGLALVVVAVLSVPLGWLVADRALRPLRTITAAARAISASSLDERLSPAGSYAEFRELGGDAG